MSLILKIEDKDLEHPLTAIETLAKLYGWKVVQEDRDNGVNVWVVRDTFGNIVKETINPEKFEFSATNMMDIKILESFKLGMAHVSSRLKTTFKELKEVYDVKSDKEKKVVEHIEETLKKHFRQLWGET